MTTADARDPVRGTRDMSPRLRFAPGLRRPRRTCGTDTRKSACPALTARCVGRDTHITRHRSFSRNSEENRHASPDQGIDSSSGSVIQPKITVAGSRLLVAASVWLFSAGWAVISASTAQDAPAPPNAAVANHRAVLDRYCVTCHNQRTKASDLRSMVWTSRARRRMVSSGRMWFASSAPDRCLHRACRVRTRRPTTRSQRFSRRNWIARPQERRIQAAR